MVFDSDAESLLQFNCKIVLLKLCKECFYDVFEEEIHQVIVKNHLFKSGERVAIGASGGKGNNLFFTVSGKEAALVH